MFFRENVEGLHPRVRARRRWRPRQASLPRPATVFDPCARRGALPRPPQTPPRRRHAPAAGGRPAPGPAVGVTARFTHAERSPQSSVVESVVESALATVRDGASRAHEACAPLDHRGRIASPMVRLSPLLVRPRGRLAPGEMLLRGGTVRSSTWSRALARPAVPDELLVTPRWPSAIRPGEVEPPPRTNASLAARRARPRGAVRTASRRRARPRCARPRPPPARSAGRPSASAAPPRPAAGADVDLAHVDAARRELRAHRVAVRAAGRACRAGPARGIAQRDLGRRRSASRPR